jgi:hypothetical protein
VHPIAIVFPSIPVSKHCMKNVGFGIVAAVLYVLVAFPVAAQTTDPLRLGLECLQAHELKFRFTIQNISKASTAAVIGSILGNDKRYLPGWLDLIVRRAGFPDVRLKYFDPTVPGVAGRLDLWLIQLPPDASYSVTVPAQNFVLTPSLAEWPFSAAPADLQMRLTTGHRNNGGTRRPPCATSIRQLREALVAIPAA